MKKAIGIIILGLLLSGCSNAWMHPERMEVVTDYYNPPLEQLKAVADAKCQSLNRGSSTVSTSNFRDEIGINRYYPFTCEKSAQEANKIDKVELASMINEAKDTCKELGFEEGTEKFSDCALKLYSQSVELAAKSKQQIVMQPQSSGSNTMTIYDPRRDSRILMKKGQRMLSGACTLGIDC